MWMKVSVSDYIVALADTGPQGTDRIWGNHDSAPDDPQNATDTHGRFFSFRETSDAEPASSQAPAEGEITPETPRTNLTMNEAGAYILSHTPNSFQKMYQGNYSNGFETDIKTLKENAKDHRKVSYYRQIWFITAYHARHSGPIHSRYST